MGEIGARSIWRQWGRVGVESSPSACPPLSWSIAAECTASHVHCTIDQVRENPHFCHECTAAQPATTPGATYYIVVHQGGQTEHAHQILTLFLLLSFTL